MDTKNNPLNLNKKYFELEQAEAQLPKIRDYLLQLQELHQSIQLLSSIEISPSDDDLEYLDGEEELSEELSEEELSGEQNEDSEEYCDEESIGYPESEDDREFSEENIPENHLISTTPLLKEYHKALYEFYTILEQLEKIGCLVKDIDEGLIDFFHHFEGRDVFLCWKTGEENISHWHEIGSGFSGRKKILR